jgi:hypothetical protein
MDAQELRTGNFIYDSRENIVEVGGINIYGRILVEDKSCDDGYYTLSDSKPIPLTEEWFERFGLLKSLGYYFEIDKKKNIEFGWNDKNMWYVYFRNKSKGLAIDDDYVILRNDLSYVHQLQNLFFALTGSELTIKKPLMENKIPEKLIIDYTDLPLTSEQLIFIAKGGIIEIRNYIPKQTIDK